MTNPRETTPAGHTALCSTAPRERKDPSLPRYAVPAALLAGWGLAGSTMVEARINGVGVGRRSLKPWDAERRFIGVAQPM